MARVQARSVTRYDEGQRGRETDDRNAKSDRGNSSLCRRDRHSIQVSISREWLDPFSGVVSASISPFSLATPVLAFVHWNHASYRGRRVPSRSPSPSTIRHSLRRSLQHFRVRYTGGSTRSSSSTKCLRLFSPPSPPPQKKNVTEYNFWISCIYFTFTLFTRVSICGNIFVGKRLKIIFTYKSVFLFDDDLSWFHTRIHYLE